MAIRAKVLTRIDFPKEIEVEIDDTVRGEKVVRRVNFAECLDQITQLGIVDLETIEPAEILSMACAVAKHKAIDEYLMSIGVDPHEGVTKADEA
ncbi:MAG: hypothetical protein AB7W28_00245 [Armatimonadota bacterium]